MSRRASEQTFHHMPSWQSVNYSAISAVSITCNLLTFVEVMFLRSNVKQSSADQRAAKQKSINNKWFLICISLCCVYWILCYVSVLWLLAVQCFNLVLFVYDQHFHQASFQKSGYRFGYGMGKLGAISTWLNWENMRKKPNINHYLSTNMQ